MIHILTGVLLAISQGELPTDIPQGDLNQIEVPVELKRKELTIIPMVPHGEVIFLKKGYWIIPPYDMRRYTA